MGDHGFFHFPVEVHDNIFKQAGDKKGLIRSRIAQHLAHAVKETGVPTEFWAIELTQQMQSAFSWPATLYFGGK